MRLAERFEWGTRCHVMGIINVTPDSFSGDGLAVNAADPVAAAEALAVAFDEDGADILDVGGESTRPGAQQLDAATERTRVVPVVAAIRATLPDAVISIDSYRADVAEAALDAGADMINDVWGLTKAPEMAAMAARRGVPVVLMHNRSAAGQTQTDARLGASYDAPAYGDFFAELAASLRLLARRAEEAGVAADQIVLDPGVGFGKTLEQNLALINELDRLKELGYPLLVGPSRKSFIGQVLDLPADQRLEGTAAAVALSVVRGADIVRVHDVRQMERVVRMTDALIRAHPVASAGAA